MVISGEPQVRLIFAASRSFRASGEWDRRIMHRNTAILAEPAGGRPHSMGFCGQDDRKPSNGGTRNATRI